MLPQIVKFTTEDGLTLVADAWGPPGQPSVILAHGGGQTRHSWRRTGEALATAGWRAIALDLRGHGDSEWAPNGIYQIDAFADDLIAVRDQIDGPVYAVGASLGGLAVLIAEGEARPGTFASVTLVDITPRMEPVGVERVMGFMGANAAEGFASIEEASETIASYLPHRPKPSDTSRLTRYLRQSADGRFRWHWDPRFITNVMTTRGERRMERLEDAARSLRIPVQLVRGRMSDLVSEEGAREFLDAVPHARFDDITGAGHMVAGDDNDAFTAAVLAFLNGIRQSASVPA